jgi:peptidoglycan hydrolase-like protein with peptidoglycan-binding domain
MHTLSSRILLAVGIFLALSSSTSAASPSFCSILNTTTTLKAGVVSTRVQELQRALNQDPSTQITTTGAGSPGKETTKYGAGTFSAVKRFQEKYRADILVPNGLTKGTGLFGSSTKKKMYALYCTGIVPPPTPGPTPILVTIPVPLFIPGPIPQPTPTPSKY